MMKTALVFPGQGSQAIGMGRDLYDNFEIARQTFEEIDEALGEKLSAIIFEGNEQDLNLTENTQPALLAVSMAIINVLTREFGIKLPDIASCVAGHSLGEYSALTAVGAIELSQTAKLVRLRGKAMQTAVPVGVGSMAAIIGLDSETVEQLVTKAINESDTEFDTVCQSANDNSVGQIVISGHCAAIDTAVRIASDMGAKKAVKLPVSAPFHCTLMAPAAQVMGEALADVNIRPPCLPVYANVTANAVTDPNEIRSLLVSQITGKVRWRESIINMKNDGIERAIEIGAGKVLSGLIRRIDREIETSNIENTEQLQQFIENNK